MGRLMGFEPMHIGTTIRGLNRLTTGAINLIIYYQKKTKNQELIFKKYKKGEMYAHKNKNQQKRIIYITNNNYNSKIIQIKKSPEGLLFILLIYSLKHISNATSC